LNLVSRSEQRWVKLIEEFQGSEVKWGNLKALRSQSKEPLRAPMMTLEIQGGKKDKLRPGDLLGALTRDVGLKGDQVGKIAITDARSYVALDRRIARQYFDRIANANIKGRRFRMRFVEDK
jgi:ATP-independent RNA helicase DbpA